MPEIAALQESLDQVRASLAEQNRLRAQQNAALAEQTEKLAGVEEKLPGFVQRRGFGLAVAVLVVCGLVVAAFVGENRRTAERFEREAIETDRAFCALTNRTFTEINKNRDANRKAYNLLVQPSTPPDAPIVKFRDDLLRTIDGNLPQLDCSGIGNGEVDFSVQDAIRNGTLPTPATAP